MVRLDHLAILVRDRARSRDWYTRVLGLKIEFEVPDRKTTALQDDGDFTLFLVESAEWIVPSCTLTFQVDDVDAAHRELAATGVTSQSPPQRLFWG